MVDIQVKNLTKFFVIGENLLEDLSFEIQEGECVAILGRIGCGKTTLSLVAATKLAMQGKRTLYVNLEDIASEECYLPRTEEKGMSEIVANLGSNVNFTMKLQSLLQSKTENLYYQI